MRRLFSRLYDRVLAAAGHRHAPVYLAALSFAESSFFPVPPDVMLAPMALADLDRARRYAWIATIASVMGGILGYLLGKFAFQFMQPLVQAAGYASAYAQVQEWFASWGFWAVFIAGFTPIPYKLFTVAAGAVSMPLLPFVLASLVGRGARFHLVAALVKWGGEPMKRTLRTHIDRLGWIVVGVAVIGFAACGI